MSLTHSSSHNPHHSIHNHILYAIYMTTLSYQNNLQCVCVCVLGTNIQKVLNCPADPEKSVQNPLAVLYTHTDLSGLAYKVQNSSLSLKGDPHTHQASAAYLIFSHHNWFVESLQQSRSAMTFEIHVHVGTCRYSQKVQSAPCRKHFGSLLTSGHCFLFSSLLQQMANSSVTTKLSTTFNHR